MLSFSDYTQSLDESLITFNKKAYPKFGNVVIMAGGAGSGKGFIKSNLLGIEGFSFDVDELKLLTVRTPKIIEKVKRDLGIDISKFDPKIHQGTLKNPDNVFKLHTIIGDELRLDNKKKVTMYASALLAPPDRKPNLIFDVTLKDFSQFEKYTLPIKKLGYENQNIHVVWVVNDIEVAMAQNEKRDRTVPAQILVGTHRGASNTLHDIINMGTDLSRYMDGDIVFAFNKVGVDSSYKVSGKGGAYVEKANYVYVKRAGEKVNKNKITNDLKKKLADYVPKNVSWEDI